MKFSFKFKLLGKLSVLTLFFAVTLSVILPQSTSYAAVDDMKAVFLHVGPHAKYDKNNNYLGTEVYATYTTSDINLYTDVNTFVIIPSGDYRTYRGGQCDPPACSNVNTDLIPKMVDLARTIKSSNKANAKVYFGLPAVDGYTPSNYYTHMYTFNTEFIANLKRALDTATGVGTTFWINNVAGIYVNGESVYGTVDYSNIIANPSIKYYNDISYVVHTTYSKKFMWVPFYSYKESNAVETIKRIGYVTNRTPIFDYVLLQPQWYFNSGGEGTEAPKSNLDGVYYSVINQKITYRDGNEVVARTSNATAKIGVQMEIDGNIFTNKDTYGVRYNDYVNKFQSLVGTYPFSYYMGSKVTYFSQIIGKINEFY